MKKKAEKVLFLCQYYPPENISSATLPRDTAEYLSKKGISVDVLTGKSKIYNNQKKIKSKEVVNGVSIKRVRYFWTRSKGKLIRMFSFITFVIAVYLRIFSFRKYKVIVVYSNPPILPKVAYLVKKLFKVKVIFVSYDVYPEIAIESNALKENSFIAKRMQKSNEKIFIRLDRVVALSDEMKEFIENNRPIDKDKVVTIPNWHKDLYDEDKKDNKNEKFVISYFGNMGVLQDIETILKTAKKLKSYDDILFQFAGHGNKHQEVKNFTIENNLKNIIVHGYLNDKDFEKVVNESDMFIVSLEPNISKLAYPSKMSSYLMGGKPIISIMDYESDITKDVKKYNLGIYVSNNEVDLLSENIIKIYKDEKQINEMSRNSRKLYLEKYTPNISLEKYHKLMLETLEEENV